MNASKCCIFSGHRLDNSLFFLTMRVFAPNPRITESQNGRGWKGPLWVTQPTPPAEAGSPRAGCTGPCPGGS